MGLTSQEVRMPRGANRKSIVERAEPDLNVGIGAEGKRSKSELRKDDGNKNKTFESKSKESDAKLRVVPQEKFQKTKIRKGH
jgi:hypothetical protein